ncbi:hypothetical protein TanjilG_03205 [Lupinus angustifolius]|uniref:Uncharacterized protein n=1 Tax=Lupinus angustifolius TaxID=3871 RepID=A0A4P1RD80_LUPAN|nr:hypothetical protein TanjilG_03205 [Lupinus angustifolius]
MDTSRDPNQGEEVKLIQGEEVVEECKTPTGSRNKIPIIQTCPHAPRKKRKFSSLMKRSSATNLNFLVRDEEVELFFKSMFSITRVPKRCRSI